MSTPLIAAGSVHVSATDGPVLDPPTARQKAVPTHDTEFRASSVVAGALTLGTTLHDVPFHCSTRVPPPVPEFSEPTATQIPVGALITRGSDRFIAVVDKNSHLHFIEIAIASTDGDTITLAQGLNPGTEIAVDLPEDATDGALVQTISAAAN